MVGGRLGSAVCAVSQAGYLKFTLVSDDSILNSDQNARLLSLTLKYIEDEIKRTKAMDENNKKD